MTEKSLWETIAESENYFHYECWKDGVEKENWDCWKWQHWKESLDEYEKIVRDQLITQIREGVKELMIPIRLDVGMTSDYVITASTTINKVLALLEKIEEELK